MSKIISPLPPLDIRNGFTSEPMACWWRFRTAPNADGYHYVIETNASIDDPDDGAWVSYEFFDGYDVTIDTGFDRPTRAQLTTFDHAVYAYFDVLSVDRPTPSDRWFSITEPGEVKHPDDRFDVTQNFSVDALS